MTLTAGELLQKLKDVPPNTPVIIYYDSGCAMTDAGSCGVTLQGDYHPEKPWNDDGTPNRVDVFFVSSSVEEEG